MRGNNEKIGGGGLHHVTLVVKDFEKSRSMYEQLGFMGFSEWEMNGVKAVLLDTGDGSYLEIYSGGSGEEARLFSHFAIRTNDCEKALAQAVKAGFKVTRKRASAQLPGDPPVPVTFAFVKGPDGEEIEFLQQKV